MFKVLLFLLLLSAVIYGVVRLLTARPWSGHTGPTRPAGPKRPVGPDDDDEFLRELARRNKPRDPEN